MAVCPACGKENPDGFQFCGFCTARLAPQRGGSRELRKTVTALFCDMTGSTTLGESVDPEALRALLTRYFERMREIVERHGGTVEKFIGDAVVAVFGVPVVREDDALRACRAAVEMRDALPELGVNCRIGVNTGEVVTTADESLATGDAMNVAARLEQAAQPGEVLIGKPTFSLVREAVVAEPIDPLSLKGKAEPVPAFRLVSVLASVERSHLSRFVGRERELALIGQAWQRAQEQSRCELVTVVGEAGVGKSRLVSEALSAMDARVVRGRCLPYGDGITYWPVVEAVKQLAVLPSDPVAASAIRSLLGESDVGTSGDEIAWAFRKLLEEQAPLICVFDDIQWGEETFLELLEATALLSSGAPLLLLCMARPELVERRSSWPATLHLDPLPPEQADVMIGDEVTPELRKRITQAAAGNPLFISEMLAMAAEDAEVEVPPTLKALMAARLDQLAEPERRVLERGSVEGEIFHRGAVQALGPEETQVTTRLAALVRHQLVRPDRAQLAGDDGYRFRHLLIRDATYDSLPKAIRAGLHARFADWLGEHGEDLVERDEIIGYHLEQAVRYLAELGRPDSSLAHAASQHLAAAGRRARSRLDYRAARSLLERALQLDERPPLHLAVDLSEVMVGPDPIELLDKAAARAEVDGDEPAAALARALACGRRLETLEASADEHERLVREAVPLLEDAGDNFGLSALWESLANGAFNTRCRYDAMEEASEQALVHAKLAGEHLAYPVMLPTSLQLGGRPVSYALRRIDTLTQTYPNPMINLFRAVLLAMNDEIKEARALAVATHDRMRELSEGTLPSAMLAEIEALAGNYEAAAELLRIHCDRLADTGQTALLSTYGAMYGIILVALGRLGEAERLAAQSRDTGDPDDPVTQALWRQVSAQVRSRRGDQGEAALLAREAVVFAMQTDSPKFQADALADLANVLIAAGRRDEAVAALRHALDLYERKGIIPLARHTGERLAELSGP